MLDFKCVNAKDFERYNKYRALDKTNASEGAFASMFIWNRYYNMEFADNGEFLFIRFNIKKIYVCDVTLQDGIIFDIIEKNQRRCII